MHARLLRTHAPHTTHPFNGPLSKTAWVSQYQKDTANLDFTEAKDSEWQWHLLDHMQVCTLLQADNHAMTTTLSFLQAGCPSCRPTNFCKLLKFWNLWLIFIIPSLKLTACYWLCMCCVSHLVSGLMKYCYYLALSAINSQTLVLISEYCTSLAESIVM